MCVSEPSDKVEYEKVEAAVKCTEKSIKTVRRIVNPELLDGYDRYDVTGIPINTTEHCG